MSVPDEATICATVTTREAFIDSPAVRSYLMRTPAGQRSLANLGYSIDTPLRRRIKPELSDRQREMARRAARRRDHRRGKRGAKV